MERFLGYFRFSFRQLRKSPSFAIAAVVTLALGIGATTAIFSLVNAVLLKPLPYPEPDRLMRITQEDHSSGAVVPESLSYPDYFDWRAQNRTLQGLASYSGRNMTLTGGGPAQQLGAYIVSSNFFQVLGVAPLLGRDFRWDEERAGNRALMLGYELWQSRFGGDRNIVGQQVTLDSERYTIAGVMPAGFHFPTESGVEAWTSLASDQEGATPATVQRGADGIEVIGRLKPGVTVAQANADLSSVARALATQYSDTNKWFTTARVLPQLEYEVGKTRPVLEVLFGAVALVLLIACVNVAGLLLVRSSRRSGEIALRGALGASRSEIVWQLLTESVVLSLISGAAGIALASGMLKELSLLFPRALPRLGSVSLDMHVLAFSMGVSVLTGILFGVVPALRISRLAPALALRDGTRTVTSGRAHHRLQTWLVIGETALGLVLLVSAGLLIRSFVSVLRVDPGFDAHQVLTARYTMSDAGYTHDQKIHFVEELTRRLNALPGVKSASAGWPMPMSGSEATISFTVEGHPLAKSDHPNEAIGVAQPGYFETMRIPLIAGRTFTDMDKTKSAPVAIIDQAFAKKYFAGVNPIGRHMTADLGDDVVNHPVREIVGVVGDIQPARPRCGSGAALLPAVDAGGDYDSISGASHDRRSGPTGARGKGYGCRHGLNHPDVPRASAGVLRCAGGRAGTIPNVAADELRCDCAAAGGSGSIWGAGLHRATEGSGDRVATGGRSATRRCVAHDPEARDDTCCNWCCNRSRNLICRDAVHCDAAVRCQTLRCGDLLRDVAGTAGGGVCGQRGACLSRGADRPDDNTAHAINQSSAGRRRSA